MGKFTLVDSQQAKGTLAREFVELADDLRDLLSQFGLRAYRVSTIRVQWSGGKRGRGSPIVIEETIILPTPKIASLDGLQELVQSVGLDEVGSVELSEVSGRFTEEQLRGFTDAGDGLPVAQEFYYEVE